MLITPQQHRLTSAGTVETAWLDQRGRQPGPFRAFVRPSGQSLAAIARSCALSSSPDGVPMDGILLGRHAGWMNTDHPDLYSRQSPWP